MSVQPDFAGLFTEHLILLRSTDENLPAAGTAILRLDAEAYPTIDILVSKIVTTAATRLKAGWISESSRSAVSFQDSSQRSSTVVWYGNFCQHRR